MRVAVQHFGLVPLIVSCSLVVDLGKVTYEEEAPRSLGRLEGWPTQSHAYFGHVVRAHETTIVVAATGADVSGVPAAGRVYVYDVTDLSAPRVELALPDPNPGDGIFPHAELPIDVPVDFSGIQVDLNDRFIVVGIAIKNERGAAYLYRRDALATPEELRPSDLATGAHFGFSLAMSNHWLAIGAPGTLNTDRGRGAVYLFHERENTFTLQQKIVPPEGHTGDFWGSYVSLARDVLAVGDLTNDAGVGVVHVYGRTETTWNHEATLSPTSTADAHVFGSSHAASEGSIVVGAPLTTRCYGPDTIPVNGAVFVFEKTQQGWTDRGCLPAAPISPMLAGWSVASDGARLLAGAPFATLADVTASRDKSAIGAGYFYENTGSAQWTQTKVLTAPEPAPSAAFGASVSLGRGFFVVGSPLAPASNPRPGDAAGATESGEVFVFSTSGE